MWITTKMFMDVPYHVQLLLLIYQDHIILKYFASTSHIYSNYYFTGHTGRINFHFEEYHGPEVFKKTFKVYVYEYGTHKEMFNVTLNKGDASTIYALNLSTSKGYYFKVVPNGQTNISGKVYR